MEIIKGIHRVEDASKNPAHANVYLVVNSGKLTIVDTGTPGNAQKIMGYIEWLGYEPSNVKTIILTHHHRDHIGSAKEIKDLTNAQVAASKEDASYISGLKKPPTPKSARFRADSFFEPVIVDVLLEEGDRIDNLTVLQTPGHTPGSIMLVDEERRVLFAGDTIRYDGEQISEAPEEYSVDMNLLRKSIVKISTLNFDVLLPGHGEPLLTNASEEVKRNLIRS